MKKPWWEEPIHDDDMSSIREVHTHYDPHMFAVGSLELTEIEGDSLTGLTAPLTDLLQSFPVTLDLTLHEYVVRLIKDGEVESKEMGNVCTHCDGTLTIKIPNGKLDISFVGEPAVTVLRHKETGTMHVEFKIIRPFKAKALFKTKGKVHGSTTV